MKVLKQFYSFVTAACAVVSFQQTSALTDMFSGGGTTQIFHGGSSQTLSPGAGTISTLPKTQKSIKPMQGLSPHGFNRQPMFGPQTAQPTLGKGSRPVSGLSPHGFGRQPMFRPQPVQPTLPKKPAGPVSGMTPHGFDKMPMFGPKPVDPTLPGPGTGLKPFPGTGPIKPFPGPGKPDPGPKPWPGKPIPDPKPFPGPGDKKPPKPGPGNGKKPHPGHGHVHYYPRGYGYTDWSALLGLAGAALANSLRDSYQTVAVERPYVKYKDVKGKKYWRVYNNTPYKLYIQSDKKQEIIDPADDDKIKRKETWALYVRTHTGSENELQRIFSPYTGSEIFSHKLSIELDPYGQIVVRSLDEE